MCVYHDSMLAEGADTPCLAGSLPNRAARAMDIERKHMIFEVLNIRCPYS